MGGAPAGLQALIKCSARLHDPDWSARLAAEGLSTRRAGMGLVHQKDALWQGILLWDAEPIELNFQQ